MSRYSDKSDFADTCLMHYSPDKIAHARISVDGIPLRVDSPKDLIPWYGNLISSMSSSMHSMSIMLTRKSQPDYIEEERIMFYIDEYVELARRYKRNKVEFTKESIGETFYLNRTEPEYKMLWALCEKHKDFLLRNWFSRGSEKSPNYKYVCNEFNRSLVETHFSKVHFSMCNRYRENLLEDAAKIFGRIYLAKTQDEWMVEKDNQYEHSAQLYHIQNQVIEYYIMLQTYGGTI